MEVTGFTTQVLADVLAERNRQFAKFGSENPLSVGTDAEKLACLSEEHGEVAKEVCEGELFGNDTDIKQYTELVQVAAVASAMAEGLLRDGRA